MNKFNAQYQIVPDSYRRYANPPRRKNLSKETDPLILDLLAGKTLLLDEQVPLRKRLSRFRTLYSYLAIRGLTLQIHVFDDIDRNIFRGVLMWAERPEKLYQCAQCKAIQVTIAKKPSSRGCISKYPYHLWREKKVEVAA